jgi:uncharacterized protein YcbX
MQVVELWRFPVKSLGGEPLERAEITDLGIVGDRHWGVQDVATGKILTARREAQLLFATGRMTDSGELDIRLPDGSAGDDASLTRWLGYEVRVVRASPNKSGTYETPIDFENEDAHPWFPWEGPEGVFHDSKRTRFSLVSLETIGDWDLRRFRTNIVVDVGGEDDLVGHSIRIGSVEADIVKQIDRCVMTTRPQPGVERDLDVLRTIHRDRAGNLAVGATVTKPGVISLGDAVAVLG